jgi:hypothetical protein
MSLFVGLRSIATNGLQLPEGRDLNHCTNLKTQNYEHTKSCQKSE